MLLMSAAGSSRGRGGRRARVCVPRVARLWRLTTAGVHVFVVLVPGVNRDCARTSANTRTRRDEPCL